MSALPPKADITGVGVNVRYVPQTDIDVWISVQDITLALVSVLLTVFEI
jgi:hypothetical protein